MSLGYGKKPTDSQEAQEEHASSTKEGPSRLRGLNQEQ